MQQVIIAIDPGKDKCGLAVVDIHGASLELELIPRVELAYKVQMYITKYKYIVVVMGNGTHHRQIMQDLEHALVVKVCLVEEYGSTLAARDLYWQHNRPSLWQRLLPSSWRSTPPLDDYAAWVIALRYIGKCI